ncbi:chain length determinant protein [SAR86 cluster bacterium SAR86E]|uniref:Chain length determinant protein n=1 Tax=SAR86 cluster bacterium SAR86E TaxID=1208365 RepID=K6G3V9_9GAMM|nr:chain length determinant protein [SAR86 cluster bacterium SAR86E]
MQDTNYNNSYDGEFDFYQLFQVIAHGKRIIISFTIIAAVLAVIYSLSLPNIYQSKALLVPVEPQEGVSSALESYSGLASLAGVSLPSQNSGSNSKRALEKLISLSFFENNILPSISLHELMAVKSWDVNLNKLVIDDDLYDEKNNSWVRDFSYPQKLIPSAQESYEVFQKKHFIIDEDKKTGFISLSIKHQSPYIAHKWAELIINQINAFYRKKDKDEAEKAVIFLNSEMIKTNFTEIKQAIATLLQKETQKLTLIAVNESYVFEYIDPPSVMEKKSEPRRAFICILGTIFGLMLGIITVITNNYIFQEKNKLT